MRKIASSSKQPEQRAVEGLRRREVAAERFFDDDASAVRMQFDAAQLLDDESKQRGWNGEVVRRALGATELLANRFERRGILIVAVDIAQQTAQRLERRRIEPAVLRRRCRARGRGAGRCPSRLSRRR